MRVERYSSQNKIIWDEFVRLSKNKHFFFYRDYMDYHSERFDDYSLMIFDNNDKIIALLPANFDGNILYSHQGLTFGGLIIKSSVKQKEVNNAFEVIVDYLKDKGIKSFLYKKIPHLYHHMPSDEDLYPLFKLGFSLIRRDVSSTIKLNNQIKYSKGRKWIVKKALSSSLVFSKSNDLKRFWYNLQDTLMKGHGVTTVHSYEEIKYLSEKFPKEIQFYSAMLGEEQVAGAVVFVTDTVAHTQYLYNNEKGREVGALDGLIDYLVKNTFIEKEYFDFGTSNENQGRDINEGLISQKEGFGARAVAHDYYEIRLND